MSGMFECDSNVCCLHMQMLTMLTSANYKQIILRLNFYTSYKQTTDKLKMHVVVTTLCLIAIGGAVIGAGAYDSRFHQEGQGQDAQNEFPSFGSADL